MTHPIDSIKQVPLLDVSRDNDPLRDEMVEAISAVVFTGRFIGGPDCKQLEETLASYCGVKHAVGCASGSDALLLSLMAVGIGAGDEVIVPSFTFFASVSAIWRLGAIPVFIDIDSTTFNLDPNQFEPLITPNTKAIMPVHLFGQCANMTAIMEIADGHGLHVIEDAAQAIGSTHMTHPAGSLGDTGCFSFYPTKNLGGLGDSGMITTNSDEIADQVRLFANHGMRPRYYHQVVGINSRLDSFQAAGLNVKMKYLDHWTTKRQENARRYEQMFTAASLHSSIELPQDDSHGNHVWNQYTIRVKDFDRDQLRTKLAEREIGSEIYYPIPMHQQECFLSLGYEAESLPNTELASRQVLSLPIFPGLAEAEQQYVVNSVREILQQGEQRKRQAS